MQWTERRDQGPRDGGTGELLRLALPFILSNSFWTLQITIDRILLSRLSSESVGAAMAAALLFWTPLTLLQNTANFAITFVAQYVGAGRSRRVGPAVWQALHFSVVAGVAFLGLVPLAGPLVALGSHSAEVRALEETYFRCLCFSALPTLVVAAVGSFFAGRGDSWTVLLINAVGMVVNGLLGYAWIFGRWGLPALGIAGAGWATVFGSSTSAVLALALMLRRRYREEFATLAGWRFEGDLMRRLVRYGLPSGLLYACDCLAFTVFLFLVGRLGDAELAASSIAFTINMVAVLPMLGVGQGVSVLVGQRLGQDRPDLAERTTWTGFRLAWLYMTAVAALYVLFPQLFVSLFRGGEDPDRFARVAVLVPVLLRFVAVYSVFDSMNLVFSFALKGAGDTRFVMAASLLLAWPLMVFPTGAAWELGWGIYWAWTFASAYIVALALTFLWRFRCGKWKAMRVIEAVSVPEHSTVSEGNGRAAAAVDQPRSREWAETE
jgi:MATE family multidrug resistance protein